MNDQDEKRKEPPMIRPILNKKTFFQFVRYVVSKT